MSGNEKTVRDFVFNAAKPKIDQIEDDLMFVLDGCPTPEAVVALARVAGRVIGQATPDGREGLIGALIGALMDAVRCRARAGGA